MGRVRTELHGATARKLRPADLPRTLLNSEHGGHGAVRGLRASVCTGWQDVAAGTHAS